MAQFCAVGDFAARAGNFAPLAASADLNRDPLLRAGSDQNRAVIILTFAAQYNAAHRDFDDARYLIASL
jgi:hypothetical protein